MIPVLDFPSVPCPSWPAVTPRPLKSSPMDGEFRLERDAKVFVEGEDAELRDVASLLVELLAPATGFALPFASSKDDANLILRVDKRIARKLGEEGYVLDVSPARVDFAGGSAKGVSRALQTFRQLLPVNVFSSVPVHGLDWKTPCVRIEDKPRFKWRGLMLDVGRHFFDKKEVLKLLDAMALHKLNVFHFHLTEDQGWRVALDSDPRLAELGSRRESSPRIDPAGLPDGRPYGPFFYTKADLREIVARATRLGIEVVPELEMPGHSLAALSVRPELSCSGGPFKVASTVGVFNDIYCAGNDAALEFLKGVIDELLEIFPSRFFHVGGDECPKERWKACHRCQERMRKEGLKNEVELQAWFLERIAAHLAAKGRRMVGWDDILESDLPKGSVVMPWRNLDGAAEAARRKIEMVMTPGSHCYFDYRQAELSVADEPLSVSSPLDLETVYSFNPVPEGREAELEPFVLGTQGNVWTECIATPEKLEYMIFPRAAALAEVAWTEPKRKSFKSFLSRLDAVTRSYDFMGLNYRAVDRGARKRRKRAVADLSGGSAEISLSKSSQLVLGGALRDVQGRLLRAPLWKGPASLSATASLRLEGRSLRADFAVTDAKVVSCPPDAKALCNYDCLELFVDFHPRGSDPKDYFQILLSPDGRLFAARDRLPPGFTSSAALSASGYVISVSFELPDDAESSIGFDFALDDVASEPSRSVQMIWSGDAANCARKCNYGLLALKKG